MKEEEKFVIFSNNKTKTITINEEIF